MNLKVAAGSSLRANDRVQSLVEKEPRKAWGERSPVSRVSNDDEGGFLDRSAIPQPTPLVIPATHISIPTRGIAFADEDENSQSDVRIKHVYTNFRWTYGSAHAAVRV
jgi:hypothetical protein